MLYALWPLRVSPEIVRRELEGRVIVEEGYEDLSVVREKSLALWLLESGLSVCVRVQKRFLLRILARFLVEDRSGTQEKYV